MKVQEESEKVGLKLNIQKTKIMASGPLTLWQKVKNERAPWWKWKRRVKKLAFEYAI